MHRLEADGNTVVVVHRDGEPAGIIAVRDELRPEAAETVAALERAGIGVTMLTGDNRRAAHALAKQAGIGDVRAELAPRDKSDAVTELAAAGHGRGTAVFFAEDRVTRPQGGHQAADQRLRFAVDDGDRVDAAGFDAGALRSTAADAQFEAAGADVVGGRGGQKDRHGAEIVDVAGEGGFGGVVVHGAIVPFFV